MSERKWSQTSKIKDPFQWGFILIDKDCNGTVAMVDSKDKITITENMPISLGVWNLLGYRKEENKKNHLEAIMKRAVDVLRSRNTGNVDGIMIYKSQSINLQGPDFDSLESKVKGTCRFEAAQLDGYLEVAIEHSKEERNLHEQNANEDSMATEEESNKDRQDHNQVNANQSTEPQGEKYNQDNQPTTNAETPGIYPKLSDEHWEKELGVTNPEEMHQKPENVSDPSLDAKSPDTDHQYIRADGPFNHEEELNNPTQSDAGSYEEAKQDAVLTSSSAPTYLVAPKSDFVTTLEKSNVDHISTSVCAKEAKINENTLQITGQTTSDDCESSSTPQTSFISHQMSNDDVTSTISTEDPKASPEKEISGPLLQKTNSMEQPNADPLPSKLISNQPDSNMSSASLPKKKPTVPPLPSFYPHAPNDPPQSTTTTQPIISNPKTETFNLPQLPVPIKTTHHVASSHADSECENRREELVKEIKELKKENMELKKKISLNKTPQDKNNNIPTTQNIQMSHQEEESPATGIICNIVPPPPQVSALHQQMMQGLKEKLSDEGLQMLQGEMGPSIVIAVNNSSLAVDVKRDLGKTGLKDVPILLLIIKATRNANEKPSVRIRDLKDDRIKEACYFLVDLNFSTIHTCQLNHDSFDSVSKYLKTFEI